jgi:hypothetical protein
MIVATQKKGNRNTFHYTFSLSLWTLICSTIFIIAMLAYDVRPAYNGLIWVVFDLFKQLVAYDVKVW